MKILTMPYLTLTLTMLAVLFASYYDYQWRRIPNFITFSTIVSGLTIHGIIGGWSGLYFSMSGLILGSGFLFFFYLLGGVGAGDVKLLGSVGALLGADKIIAVFIFTALAGGFMAFYQKISHQNPGKVKNIPDSHIEHVKVCDPVKESIPYGIAIAVGTVITLGLQVL